MALRLIWVAALTALLGCGDDSGPVGPVDGGAGPIPLPPIPGGGTTGGSILGRLVVYVLYAGAAVPEVTVAVDTPDGRRTSVTDADGRIELKGADLRGPVTITAFLADGPYVTLAGVNAAGVSIDLAPELGGTPAAAFAVGAVRGWENLDPGPDALVAEVRPIVRNVLAPSVDWPQASRDDIDLPENVALASLPTYRLRLDAGNAVGVYARARRQGAPPDAPFEYLGLGPARPFTAGATVSVDLTLDIALDQRVQIDARQRPSLPLVALLPILRLADGGLVALSNAFGVSSDTLTLLAPRSGAIRGADLAAVALGRDGVGQQTVRWFPLRGAMTSLPAFLPIPTPVRGLGPRSAEIPGPPANMVQWVLTKDGRTVWIATVVGPARLGAWAWPEPPDGRTDPVTGETFVSVSSFDFGGLEPNRVSFNQLSLSLQGLALGFAQLRF